MTKPRHINGPTSLVEPCASLMTILLALAVLPDGEYDPPVVPPITPSSRRVQARRMSQGSGTGPGPSGETRLSGPSSGTRSSSRRGQAAVNLNDGGGRIGNGDGHGHSHGHVQLEVDLSHSVGPVSPWQTRLPLLGLLIATSVADVHTSLRIKPLLDHHKRSVLLRHHTIRCFDMAS